MTPRTLTLMALLALAPAPSRGAIAANLLQNPGFDDDVVGWSHPGSASVEHTDLDERSVSDSGSLRFQGLPANTAAQSKSACFAVDGGQPIVFGASTWATTQVNHKRTAVLMFWSGASCTGATLGAQAIATDLDAFPAHTWSPTQGYGTVPMGAQSARLGLNVQASAAALADVHFDNAFVYQGIRCAATPTVACLNEGRFRFVARWETPDGVWGSALVKPFAVASDSAYATFFSPSNVELVVKVLNGCGLNERFWVFASGLTNVEAVLSVKDTFHGTEWSRINSQNKTFQPILDTAAFATCPH